MLLAQGGMWRGALVGMLLVDSCPGLQPPRRATDSWDVDCSTLTHTRTRNSHMCPYSTYNLRHSGKYFHTANFNMPAPMHGNATSINMHERLASLKLR